MTNAYLRAQKFHEEGIPDSVGNICVFVTASEEVGVRAPGEQDHILSVVVTFDHRDGGSTGIVDILCSHRGQSKSFLIVVFVQVIKKKLRS